HVLAATAYYQLNDFRSLIPHIQTAIDRSDKPEKPWFDLLLAAYFELKDFRNAADLLTEMLERYPESRDYWLQLVGVYQQLDRNKQSLAVMELALEKGILEKEEIIQLAQMYLQEDLPFKAAKLLQEKIDNNEIGKNRDNLELLANSWQLAQETERAAATLKQLADISNDTAVYYRLGQIYFELERWQDCIEILEKVIDDDDFENQANATLLAGIAAYHLEDSSRSRKALNKALGYDSTRQQAEWWLDKLETRDESGISG
ncbi:MAG TPA: CDC27 family protein, partial [Gammaproteobacteria bacterium]|nr:CDC27 family protein [Gammaproteobacteria bacterium]